jgi:uncharacterized membrane protein
MTYDPYELNREAEINEILQRPYTVNVGQYLNRSMELFQQKAGELIGYTLLYFIISIGLQQIPYIGPIVGGVIAGVLVAGYYFFAFRFFRGQNTEFGDFFLGFRNNQFWPIVLVNFLIGLVVLVLSILPYSLMALGIYPALQDFFARLRAQSPSSDIPELPDLPIPPGLSMIFLLLGLLLLIPIIYLSICYIFAPLLVIDRRLGAWQAMETSRKLVNKQWLSWFGFCLLQGLIAIAGYLACCIGLLLAFPIVVCSTAAAYEQVVGLPQRNSLPEEGGFP